MFQAKQMADIGNPDRCALVIRETEACAQINSDLSSEVRPFRELGPGHNHVAVQQQSFSVINNRYGTRRRPFIVKISIQNPGPKIERAMELLNHKAV